MLLGSAGDMERMKQCVDELMVQHREHDDRR
jgi:hypothetical protein